MSEKTHLSFFVIGEPKGQPRARAFARKIGGKYTARMYDTGTADDWKKNVGAEALRALSGHKFHGPVSITIEFFMPRPKRLRSRNSPQDAIPHDKKPDLDNLTKAVMDALTDVEAWGDDSQVYAIQARKLYEAKNALPGCFIAVEGTLTKGA